MGREIKHNSDKTKHTATKHNTMTTKQSKTRQKHLGMDRSNFPESGSMFFLVTILTASLARFAILQM